MTWENALAVINRNRGQYFLWTLSVFGGFLIPIAAAGTIWYYHRILINPGITPEVLLVTAIVTIGVVGYQNILYWRGEDEKPPSSLLAYGWILIPMLTYGMLVSAGVATPAVEPGWLWGAGAVLGFLSFIWSTLLWAEIVERSPLVAKKAMKKLETNRAEGKEKMLEGTEGLPSIDLSDEGGVA